MLRIPAWRRGSDYRPSPHMPVWGGRPSCEIPESPTALMERRKLKEAMQGGMVKLLANRGLRAVVEFGWATGPEPPLEPPRPGRGAGLRAKPLEPELRSEMVLPPESLEMDGRVALHGKNERG